MSASTAASPPRVPVLVITELFLPTKGGTAVWFAEVYRRLGGREIHIVTAEVPGSAATDAEVPNTVHRVTLERHAWLRPESLAMYLRLLWRSLRVARRERFAAIHAGRVLPEGLVGLIVARLCRLPLVIYAHGEELTGWRTPGKHWAKCFTLRHADRIIANSRFTHGVLRDLGVREERITQIMPGVDTQRFRRGLDTAGLRAAAGIPAAGRLLLSVGRLQERKGFDMVIRALAGLRRDGIDVAYAIIGIGDDRGRLAALARELGVADHVHFLGHVPMDDLPRWYNAADLFAMPNRDVGDDTEGFGIVYLEAAACGRPAIAGLAGGTGDAVEDGVTGLRVDGNDAGQVAGAIRRLLTDEGFSARLAEQAWQRVQASFSWEQVARATRALQDEMTIRARPRRS